jgi:hypothetical protein
MASPSPCGTCGKSAVWTVGKFTAWWECPNDNCPSRGHDAGGEDRARATKAWNSVQAEGPREWLEHGNHSQLMVRTNCAGDES